MSTLRVNDQVVTWNNIAPLPFNLSHDTSYSVLATKVSVVDRLNRNLLGYCNDLGDFMCRIFMQAL